MAERVLPDPLTGLEIRRAVAELVGRSLEKDGFLNPDTAYDRFDCEVSIKLRCHDIGRVAVVEQTVKDSGKTAEASSDDALLEEANKQFEIHSDSPNEMRVDTGQEVPVLTKDSEGKETIKHVRYSRKELAKAK